MGEGRKSLRIEGCVDLRQRRVTGTGRVVPVHRPVAVAHLDSSLLRASALCEHDRKGRAAAQDHHPWAHGVFFLMRSSNQEQDTAVAQKGVGIHPSGTQGRRLKLRPRQIE